MELAPDPQVWAPGLLSDRQLRALSSGDRPLIEPFFSTQQRDHERNARPHELDLLAKYRPNTKELACELLGPGVLNVRNDPLLGYQVREKLISYGCSSYGYDVRCSNEFKIFTNVNNTVIDPKNFDDKCFVDYVGDCCIIPPNSFALARTVEYFRIRRDMLTVCLGKSTYARCFTGSTKVALANGEAVSFADMVERAAAGEKFFGYGIHPKKGVMVTELVAPRKIGRNEKLVRVHLDDGSHIDCTPDHKFLTREGRYVQAQNLDKGQSLMPLYRYRTGRGREFLYAPVAADTPGPKNRQYKLTYHLADAYNLRTGKYRKSMGTDRHHEDHNVMNDYPTNIIRMDHGEHASEHVVGHNARHWTPENRRAHSRAVRKALRKLAKDPKWAAQFSRSQTAKINRFWREEKYSERRAAMMEKRNAHWSKPEVRKAASTRMKKVWASDEGKKIFAARVMPSRHGLSEKRVDLALRSTGSILQAALMLGTSKPTLLRNFKHIIESLKAKGVIQTGAKIDLKLREVEKALRATGSINAAAKLLGVSGTTVAKSAAPLVKKLRKEGAIAQGQPNNHKVVRVEKLKHREDVYCLTSPETGNFALEAGVFVKNCGIIVNVTPFEPEWEGHVTLEFSNTTPLPAKIYANEGCAQILFFKSSDECDVSYLDRGGKYQGQTGVTLPKA